jgi:hypothetical protein
MSSGERKPPLARILLYVLTNPSLLLALAALGY